MNKFLITALSATDSPTRLPPAMNVGIHLDAALFDALLERTAIKPDFFVRDMLTWEHLSVGLIHDPDDDVARVAWWLAVRQIPDNNRAWLVGPRRQHDPPGRPYCGTQPGDVDAYRRTLRRLPGVH